MQKWVIESTPSRIFGRDVWSGNGLYESHFHIPFRTVFFDFVQWYFQAEKKSVNLSNASN